MKINKLSDFRRVQQEKEVVAEDQKVALALFMTRLHRLS